MTENIYTCEICGKLLHSEKASISHQAIHNSIYYAKCCHIVSRQEIYVRDIAVHESKIHNCKMCNCIIVDKHFCSRSCSASFNNKKRDPRSITSRKKTSVSMQKFLSDNPQVIESKKKNLTGWKHTKICRRECNCCTKWFWSANNRVCCSPECARINSTYRKIVHEYIHEGKLLKLESAWEVEIANHLTSLSVQWVRPNHIPWIDSCGKSRKYFPDFYLPEYNIYLDPKNTYQIEKSKEKLDNIQQSHSLYYGTVQYLKEIIDNLIQSRDSNPD